MATATLIPVFDPATGDTIAEVPAAGPADVDLAVVAARRSFVMESWRGLSGSERSRILWRVADLIDANLDDLVALESRNSGMAQEVARWTIANGAEAFRYNSGWCTRLHGMSSDLITDGALGGGRTNYQAFSRREPIGVVALITPWTAPFGMACAKLAPALAAGCSMILKPAEQTPLSALRLAAILEQAGIPTDVVNVITGSGKIAGAALAAHPDVDKIAFTGTTAVGKQIVAAAAGNLKKVSLQLGGKTPVLVFEDADLVEASKRLTFSAFFNSGQTCIAGSRLLVQRSIFEPFVDSVVQLASALQPRTQLGPIISAGHAERIMSYVADASRAGARILTGGHRLDGPGNYIEPTVLAVVDSTGPLFRDEIYGPVLAVMPFDQEEDAIRAANDTTYGLAAAVWTSDMSRALRLSKYLQAGTIWLNCQSANDVGLPYGGYKQSGWGREHGWESVEAFLESKSVFARI